MATEDAEPEELQRLATTADGGQSAPRSQQAAERVVTSGGSPLTPHERAYFEPRFGRDFSGVRVHLGGEANDAAHGINAFAFTLGRHIAFADGQFRFDTQQGRRVIAHELAHTLQQTEAIQRSDWGWTGLAGRCCNTSSSSEWAIVGEPSEWRELPSGECTGFFDDCDGMTCGGGFYQVSNLHRGTCNTPRHDDPYSSRRRWTPGAAAPEGRSPTERGGPDDTPPGYTYDAS